MSRFAAVTGAFDVNGTKVPRSQLEAIFEYVGWRMVDSAIYAEVLYARDPLSTTTKLRDARNYGTSIKSHRVLEAELLHYSGEQYFSVLIEKALAHRRGYGLSARMQQVARLGSQQKVREPEPKPFQGGIQRKVKL